MYKTRILIISSRKELAIKYKKMFENLSQDAFWTNNLAGALEIIQKEETEFIIISDTIKEKLSAFIEKIRALTYNFRPVIIAISKSSDLQDKLDILKSGADDVLGEELSKGEVQMRLLAHIRRYIETFLNPITGLSDKNITIKALKQSFYDENDFAYLDVKIKGLDLYRRIHGEIAFEKAIKTLGAIITSTIDKNDFVGHLSEDEMLLIVNPIIGEKTASFLTFAFDNILNKFYSEKEFENNFTLQTAEEIKENKEGLMRLNIALVEKSTKKSPTDILNTLHELLNLLTNSTNSTYIVDRAKLKGETLNLNKNKVLIYEPDYALSLLLENVCIMNKIEVTTVFDYFEFAKKYQSINPNLVILDFSAKNSLEIAKTISKNSTKLIFSSSSLNKKEILKSGADLYMPKPYDIEDMIHSIKKFLN